jgi:hypothetical protein
MSRAVSPSSDQPYGVARVAAVWNLARSSFYAARQRQQQPREPKKRGPKVHSDEELVGEIRQRLRLRTRLPAPKRLAPTPPKPPDATRGLCPHIHWSLGLARVACCHKVSGPVTLAGDCPKEARTARLGRWGTPAPPVVERTQRIRISFGKKRYAFNIAVKAEEPKPQSVHGADATGGCERR